MLDGCITYIQRHFKDFMALFNGYAAISQHFSIQREKAGCSARSNPPCVGTRNGKEETATLYHIFDPRRLLLKELLPDAGQRVS